MTYTTDAEVRVLSTHLGDLTVYVFGEGGLDKTLAICLPGAARMVAMQWEPTAKYLSENGYQVCIVDFHSNSKTTPGVFFGGVAKEDVAKIINETIFSEFQRANAVLLGKSWGANMAALYATAHPESVIRLCLIAPAFTTAEKVADLNNAKVLTFLGWTKDDMIMRYSNSETWKDGMGCYLVKFQSPETGGHNIVGEYNAEILIFFQTPVSEIKFDRSTPVAGVVSEHGPQVGELRHIVTHLGDVQMRVVGTCTKDNTAVVCLPGGKAPLFHEWTAIAALLAEKGFVVCVINFHSNPNTAPGIMFGGIQPDDVSLIINQTILKEMFNVKKKAIIMGKSWGGFQASQYCCKFPEKVIAMLIQAPAFSTTARIAAVKESKVPTLFAIAKDDPLVWYSTAGKWEEGLNGTGTGEGENTKQMELYTAETGGHAYTPEYHAPFLAYIDRLNLTGNRPSSSLYT